MRGERGRRRLGGIAQQFGTLVVQNIGAAVGASGTIHDPTPVAPGRSYAPLAAIGSSSALALYSGCGRRPLSEKQESTTRAEAPPQWAAASAAASAAYARSIDGRVATKTLWYGESDASN